MIAYGDAVKKLRNTLNPVFGDSWSLSCPVPDVIKGIPVDKHFLYAISMGARQSRPFALVISDMETGTILIMKHCAAEDFVDTARHPFDEPISNDLPRRLGIKEYKARMEELRAAYQNLRQMVFKSRASAGKEDAAYERYMALLEELTPVSHAPYYAAMRGDGEA